MLKTKKKKWILLIALQLVVMFFSLSTVAAKFAAGSEFFSKKFCIFYGSEICILGIYAILWQQIIKRIDLSIAYANRSMALLWSMVWAVVIFREHISIQNIIGVILALIGMMVVNRES